MSKVSISYSSLRNAKGESKALSKKLDKYADHLNDQVYRKLTSYSGTVTDNISQAKSNLSSKISNLRSASQKYENYARDLGDLKDECKNVDKSVKSKVSNLTASFKKNNGIRNSHIENGFAYIGTSLGNSTAGGRWVRDKKDEFDTDMEYIRDSIKEWYNYEGGKELIKGVLVGVLEVVGAVLAVIIAITTGGALIAVIAGVIAGCIALFNGIINIGNEIAAYETTQFGDPATARRYSREDSIQDVWRTEAEYASSEWQSRANAIDFVNTVCTAITVISSLGKLAQNSCKWATGENSLKGMNFKQILSGFKGKFSEIAQAFKTGGWSTLKDYGKFMTSDFIKNLNGKYFKQGIKSVKSVVDISKDFIKKGITFRTVFDFLAPGFTVFKYEGTEVSGIIIGDGGQMQMDFSKNSTLDEISGIVEKFTDGKLSLSNDDSSISSSVLEKLSTSCNVKINIPDIYVPQISLAA